MPSISFNLWITSFWNPFSPPPIWRLRKLLNIFLTNRRNERDCGTRDVFSLGVYIFFIYAQNKSKRPAWHGGRTCQIWQVFSLRCIRESVCLHSMSKRKFTPEAALLWGTILAEAKKRILKSAICAKCNTFVELVNYYGTVEKGDLILEGDCSVCGHAAARVVEFSKMKHGNNWSVSVLTNVIPSCFRPPAADCIKKNKSQTFVRLCWWWGLIRLHPGAQKGGATNLGSLSGPRRKQNLYANLKRTAKSFSSATLV